MTPSRMAGVNPTAASPEAHPMQGAVTSVIERVRSMESDLQTISQSHPQATPECRKAVDALRNVLKKVVSSMKEPAAPAIVG
jgi:hypothetical protein